MTVRVTPVTAIQLIVFTVNQMIYLHIMIWLNVIARWLPGHAYIRRAPQDTDTLQARARSHCVT